MKRRDWIRLYRRMIDSPQVLELEDPEFRLLVSLWCLADDESRPGTVAYSVRALQRRCMAHHTEQAVGDMLNRLMEVGLLEQAPDGAYVIPRWIEHQYDHPSQTPWAQRARRQQRLQKEQTTHDHVMINGRSTDDQQMINGRSSVDQRLITDENASSRTTQPSAPSETVKPLTTQIVPLPSTNDTTTSTTDETVNDTQSAVVEYSEASDAAKTASDEIPHSEAKIDISQIEHEVVQRTDDQAMINERSSDDQRMINERPAGDQAMIDASSAFDPYKKKNKSKKEKEIKTRDVVVIKGDDRETRMQRVREQQQLLDDVMSRWNRMLVTENPRPLARVLGATRKRAQLFDSCLRELEKSLGERYQVRTLTFWEFVFEQIRSQDFLCGDNEQNWCATFDWLIEKPDRVLRVLEGYYRQSKKPNGGGPARKMPWDNAPPEVAAVYKRWVAEAMERRYGPSIITPKGGEQS